MSFTKRASIVGCGVLALAAAQTASAVVVDFENPPYTETSVYGQDGWGFNSSYIPQGNNGSFDVSTSAPLSGSQSALYTQTSTGSIGADASKPNVITVVKDGTATPDLTASVLLQADNNSVGNGQIGLFLGPDAPNGTSAIGVLLENANSTSGTGNIYALDGAAGFTFEDGYAAPDVLEFKFDVDFDNSNYGLAYRNVTLGQVAYTPLTGGGTDGRFDFFGAFPDDGDGQSYTVDAGLFLRAGTGRVDNISLAGTAPIPEPGTAGLALLGLSALALRRRRSQRGA